jgi:hypothetical protein
MAELQRRDVRGTSAPDRLALDVSVDVDALYPHLYFASADALAGLTAQQLVDAVLRPGGAALPAADVGPGERRGSAYPVAQFVVSSDPPARFDPELSMREPLELQVWPDGTFAVEIEFVGVDVRTDPSAGDSVGAVLTQWAQARGWRLTHIYNDRGRSLPDVWNARFVGGGAAQAVADAVDFARRAARVAETHSYSGSSVDRLVALLRSGDVVGLTGTPVTAVFQPRPALSADTTELVLDVCAFASAVHGGLVVVGLAEQDGRVTDIDAFPTESAVDRISGAVSRCVYPAPEGLFVEAALVDASSGVVFIVIPPQDAVLKPFLVHGGIVDADHHAQGVTLVERRDTTIYSAGIAALHAQIAAGGALLRRDGDQRGNA